MDTGTLLRTNLIALRDFVPLTSVAALRDFMKGVIPMQATNPQGVSEFEQFIAHYKLDSFLPEYGHLLNPAKSRFLRVDRGSQETQFFAGSFFKDIGGRVFVPLYVRQGNVCTINFYYLSNSQRVFRLLPFVFMINGVVDWYSKGPYGEHSLNAPVELQKALHDWLLEDSGQQADISRVPLDFMPDQRAGYLEAGGIEGRLREVQQPFNAAAFKKSRKALTGEDSGIILLEETTSKGKTTGQSITYESFSSGALGPDHATTHVLCEHTFSTIYAAPSLVQVSSHDNTIRYLFIRTSEGSFLGLQEINSPLTPQGLNRDIIGNFPELWLTPLYEYFDQIKAPFVRDNLRVKGSYTRIANLGTVVVLVGDFERSHDSEEHTLTQGGPGYFSPHKFQIAEGTTYRRCNLGSRTFWCHYSTVNAVKGTHSYNSHNIEYARTCHRAPSHGSKHSPQDVCYCGITSKDGTCNRCGACS